MTADHQYIGMTEQVTAHVDTAFMLFEYCVIEKQRQTTVKRRCDALLTTYSQLCEKAGNDKGYMHHEGMQFSTNVYWNKEDTVSNDIYIEEITVDGTLQHSKKDSVKIIVETDDLPNGEYLEGSIKGTALSLKNDEIIVKKNKAVFVVESKSSTSIGVYTFKVSYDGHYRAANVVVSDSKSDAPYIIDVEVSGNLKEGKSDRIKVIVYTNGLSNGQYMTATLSGKSNGSTIYPANAGLV